MNRKSKIIFIVVVIFIVIYMAPGLWRTNNLYGVLIEGLSYWLLVDEEPVYEPLEEVDLDWSSSLVNRVDPRFLSFAVDSSVVVGGNWWSKEAVIESAQGPAMQNRFQLSDPNLVRLTKELTPGFLRIGGTEADRIFYELSGKTQEEVAIPEGYEFALTKNIWEEIYQFNQAIDADLFFTLNGGPGPRDSSRVWRSDNARELISYSVNNNQDVAVWELGNEPNVYWSVHGIKNRLGGTQYGKDIIELNKTVKELDPDAKVLGPVTQWWPLLGELMEPVMHFTEKALKTGGRAIDVVTWHYYPMQSRRCPEAVRRAQPKGLLNPWWLDDMNEHIETVKVLHKQYAPHAELWMGEIGSGQCGGEPGVSDTYISTLWWLDTLGTLAQSNYQVVVRQSLVGSHYGLLDDESLLPRPDYWASVLWQRLMGEGVLQVDEEQDNPFLRTYAHCTKNRPGHTTFLLINTHETQGVVVHFPEKIESAEVYRLSADNLFGKTIKLNEKPIYYNHDVAFPVLDGRFFSGESIPIPSLTSTFLVVPLPCSK